MNIKKIIITILGLIVIFIPIISMLIYYSINK